MFHDKLDVHSDDRLIELLNRGWSRAVGLPEDENEPEEQKPQDDSSPEPKPN